MNSMNISIDGGFASKITAQSRLTNANFPSDLSHFIQEYQNAQNENTSIAEKPAECSEEIRDTMEDQVLYATVKNQKLPIRMFKDRMELLKENREKKNIVSSLEAKNTHLKQQYDTCLINNQKIEQFLKEIQFTFKNDSSNQKASDTLLRAKKNLHREQKDSENHIDRLMKKSKVNQIRQLKMYLKVLREDKKRLEEVYSEEVQENQYLRRKQDLNEQQRQKFDSCQHLVNEILNHALVSVENIRKTDEQEKLIINTQLNKKKIEDLKQQSQNVQESIKNQLLKKQGLEYEIQILKSKNQQKNKRYAKEENERLKKQIILKKRRMTGLRQQLRQKIKTQQYITKWTKQLKFKLDQLKEEHLKVKQRFQQEINKLSREIQEWNRKYKAELVEEQFVNRKSVPKQSEKRAEATTQQRKIRVVKIEEIGKLRKKMTFTVLKLKMTIPDFINTNILYRKEGNISLKQIHDRLRRLKILQDQSNEDVFKLARYIIQDNGSQFSKIDLGQKISVSLAFIILKNLLNSSLTVDNCEQTQIDLVSYLNQNFDLLKNQIWLHSGKTNNFTPDTLKMALGKYIKEEERVSRLVEMIEFNIWRHFKSTLFFELLQFEMVCEKILGRKLVKDPRKRISKMTVRKIFDSLYTDKPDGIRQSQNQQQINQSINE